MDLLEKSSILLTPTAYNNGEALCIKPDDGSGDFQFSRNSAATRVNAQGLVENVQILSSNLVQNGDFSEEGVQEVSNGSFSQEGVQLVTNGSFDTDSDWNKNSNWSIGGNVANCDGTSNGDINQGTTLATIGKSYKISYEVVSISQGEFFFKFGGVNGTLRNSIGVYTETIQAINTNRIALDSSNNAIGSIDNVSVREVGQDWTLGTGWSIAEDKASSDGSVAANSYLISTGNTLTIGKTHKVQYTVLDYIQGNVRVRAGQASSIFVNADGTYTEYMVATTTESVRVQANSNFIGSITNISVKEVGMDWDFVGEAELTEQGARILSTSGGQSYINQTILTNTKRYKVSYDIVDSTQGAIKLVNVNGLVNYPIPSTIGSHTVYFTANNNTFYIYRNIGATDITITNISVIEISTDTNLPRISYENFSYQDALGSELITNGDFATDSSWDKTSAVIENGKATINVLNGAYAAIVQTPIPYVSGKTYILKATIQGDVGSSGNQMKFQDNGNNSGGLGLSNGGVTLNESIQNFEVQWVANANSTNLVISRNTNSGNYSFSIDNVSVKEYLGQEVVPNSGCGSWLFESQSTNIITYSSDFSDSSWANTYTLIPNSVVSPSGELNAFEIVVGIGNGNLRSSNNVSSNTEYVFSFYAKRGTASEVKYRVYDFTNSTDIVPKTSYYSQTNTDSWVRIEVPFTTGATTTVLGCYIDSDSQGNGSFYAWGAMLEQGNISSYIPTNGSQVTRNQDVCTNGGSLATINSTEGTLYFEGSALANENLQRWIALSDGTHNNTIKLGILNSTTVYKIAFNVRVGGVNQAYLAYDFGAVQPTFKKCAVKYKQNDFALWIDGVEVATDTSGNTPIGLSELAFDRGDGGQDFFGKTKALAVWKEALSDQELTELTTI